MKESIIESTLTYGYNMTRWKVIMCFVGGLVNCILLFAVAINELMEDDLGGMVVLLASGLLFGIMGVALFVIQKRIKSKIDLWLADAVELEAFCTFSNDYVRHFNGSIKIVVEFDYEGISMNRVSGKHQYTTFGSSEDGYSRFFRRYVDKKIKILYSPKYNQVMIPYQ